jgi:hypothetical protein
MNTGTKLRVSKASVAAQLAALQGPNSFVLV